MEEKKSRKKLIKVLLVFVMAIIIVGCEGSTNNDSASDETITLTIGISPDYWPYEQLNENGSIEGFDADMVALFEKYLTEEEGVSYKLKFRQMDFNFIVTQIQLGQIDLGISGFTYSEDRNVEWSKPYLDSSQVAVVNADSDIKTLADLEGRVLGVQTGTTGEEAAKAVKNANVQSSDDANDLFNALAEKKYDAVIIDSGVANAQATQGNFIVLEDELVKEENYIIAREGNKDIIEKINKCIDKFLVSKEYKVMCEKYSLKALSQ